MGGVDARIGLSRPMMGFGGGSHNENSVKYLNLIMRYHKYMRLKKENCGNIYMRKYKHA